MGAGGPGVFYLGLAIHVEAWLVQKRVVWQLAAAVLLPGVFILINPKDSPYAISACGVLLGFGLGVILERRWIRFSTGAGLLKKFIRYVAGLLVLFGIWMGLRIGFAGLEPAWVFRVVRYALVGLWAGLGAPWLFVHLKLAEPEK